MKHHANTSANVAGAAKAEFPTIPMDAAKTYAARGWFVFPAHGIVGGRCTCGTDCGKDAGKHPNTDGQDWKAWATRDPVKIERHWTKFPNDNVAGAMGKVSEASVSDLDVKTEYNGLFTFDALKAGREDSTLISLTGGGGQHRFYRYNPEIKNTSCEIAPGIDTRNDGGYVILPPSVHRSGKTYQWLNWPKEPAPWPEWLREGAWDTERDQPVGTVKKGRGRPKAPSKEDRGAAAAFDVKNPIDVTRLTSALTKWDANNIDQWRDVFLAIGRSTDQSEEGYLIADQWAQAGDTYGVGTGLEDQRRFYFKESAKDVKNPINIATIFFEAKKRGWIDPHPPVPLSEDLIATVFAQRYAQKCLFNHSSKAWHFWSGSHWRVEETRLTYEQIRQVTADLNVKGSSKWSKSSVYSGAEMIARSDRTFARTSSDFDRDPMLLGTPGGVVDLRTGKLMTSDPSKMISRVTSVAPADEGAVPKKWLAFLEEAFDGDKALIRFIQQFFGYALTGDVREQVLMFIHGDGGNGKTLLVSVIGSIMGDYAQVADMAVFVASKHERHPQELAALEGARLVTSSETEKGHTWSESRLKQLTGGDRIRARFMRENDREFDATHKLVIIGNHAPKVLSVGEAMKRRLRMVPMNVVPRVQNLSLKDELLSEEGPSILRWLIDGCLDWQRSGGLSHPQAVIDLSAQYLNAQQPILQWLEERCDTTNKRASTPSAQLFASWNAWAKRNNEIPGTSRGFASEMQRLGYENAKSGYGVMEWRGVRLLPVEHPDDPDQQRPF